MPKTLSLPLPFLLSLFLLFSCKNDRAENTQYFLKSGIWSATISLQGQEVPFLMEVLDSNNIEIINGAERLAVEAQVSGDSIIIPMHIFDTVIKAKIEDETLNGIWKKNYVADYTLPFKAIYGKSGYYSKGEKPTVDIIGKWSVAFQANSGRNYDAIGTFNQEKSSLSGSFLTATGDYRFLNGFVYGNKLRLSTFDGENAYLFRGTVQGDSITTGEFWSGKTFFASWSAMKNDNASLPDPDTLTYLKEGFDKISFSFPNLDGNTVSLSDEKYKNKVVIVQLFGTWCPNCMDETVFLSEWYRKQSKDDVAIIGLAYEKKPDFAYARERVQTMVEKLDVPYDFLIAGSTQKGSAANSLPMLNHVMSFPTTIIIDKTGKVRKIHTGFSGPGTGAYYTQFVEEFNQFMDKLL